MADGPRLGDAPGTSRRSRLGVVVTLLVVGIGLAGVSSVTGADELLPGSGADASLDVSEDNVTVISSGTEEPVIRDVSNVTAIEISDQGGEIVVDTERSEPFTPAERSEIVDIARQNGTVRDELGDLTDYEFSVEPIQYVELDSNAGERTEIEFDVVETSPDGDNHTETADEYDVVEIDTDDGTGTVHIDREQQYLEDRAEVIVRERETGQRHLSAVVDITDQRVRSVSEQ